MLPAALGAQVASSVLSKALGGGKSASARSGGTNVFNDRTYVTVQPVGVNVGEIFRNFEGPPSNGGFGFEQKSLFKNPSKVNPVSFSAGVSGSAGVGNYILFAAVGAGILFFVYKRRK